MKYALNKEAQNMYSSNSTAAKVMHNIHNSVNSQFHRMQNSTLKIIASMYAKYKNVT